MCLVWKAKEVFGMALIQAGSCKIACDLWWEERGVPKVWYYSQRELIVNHHEQPLALVASVR